MTTEDLIKPILIESYGDYFLCKLMAETLARKIDTGTMDDLGRGREHEMMVYIWMNTTGGDTAARTAAKIEAALKERENDSR
jgi:hypothetical protein